MSFRQNRISPADEIDTRLFQDTRPTVWLNPTPQRLYYLVAIGAGTPGLLCAADQHNRTRLSPRAKRIVEGVLAFQR